MRYTGNMVEVSQTWLLWASLLVIAALGLWAERLRWGARTSSVVITLLLAMAVANLGLVPRQAPVYDVIHSYLVPLAIPLLILKADLLRGWRDLVLTAGATLLAIAAAAISIVLVSFFLPESIGKGDWIDQSTEGLIGGHSASAVQSLLLTLFLVLIFMLPSISSVRRWFHEAIRDDRWASTIEILITENRKGSRLYLPSIALTLALTAVICTASVALAPHIGLAGQELLLIAGISLMLSLAVPKRFVELSGAEDLGILIMLLLFAIIGARADLGVIREQPALLLMTGLALILQFAIILVAGKFLRLSLPQLVIAANACVGGAASATALAASRRWSTLLFPAVLYATIGQLLAPPVAKLLQGLLS